MRLARAVSAGAAGVGLGSCVFFVLRVTMTPDRLTTMSDESVIANGHLRKSAELTFLGVVTISLQLSFHMFRLVVWSRAVTVRRALQCGDVEGQ